jgi:RNA polymerase sigma-70 factor (ECF subfamily)
LIHLRFYRECSYEEIAEICGIPLGTVKSRLRRALDRLATLYEQMETGGDENAHR